jgi:hypothetical protein
LDRPFDKAFLTQLGFAYVIRLRGNIQITDAHGERRTAAEWVGAGGRARTLGGAKVTAKEYPVGTGVCVHANAMKEPWCLAASDPQGQSKTLINYYGKRWCIETSFRDTKDLRFGMRMRCPISANVFWEVVDLPIPPLP